MSDQTPSLVLDYNFDSYSEFCYQRMLSERKNVFSKGVKGKFTNITVSDICDKTLEILGPNTPYFFPYADEFFVTHDDVVIYVSQNNTTSDGFASSNEATNIDEVDNPYFMDKLEVIDVTIRIGGLKSVVEKVYDALKEYMFPLQEKSEKYIKWVYAAQGLPSIAIKLKEPREIHNEFYPYIPKVKTVLEEYRDSSSNILIFNGPPGTGKTTLINQMVQNFGWNATTTYDEDVMKMDQFYIQFISDRNSDCLILEDADMLLLERIGSLNKVMSKILNLSDGLASLKKKKIIFTANLENISKVDKALTRPGRCFGVFEFRTLDIPEAKAAAKFVKGSSVDDSKKEYALSELFPMNRVKKFG